MSYPKRSGDEIEQASHQTGLTADGTHHLDGTICSESAQCAPARTRSFVHHAVQLAAHLGSGLLDAEQNRADDHARHAHLDTPDDGHYQLAPSDVARHLIEEHGYAPLHLVQLITDVHTADLADMLYRTDYQGEPDGQFLARLAVVHEQDHHEADQRQAAHEQSLATPALDDTE